MYWTESLSEVQFVFRNVINSSHETAVKYATAVKSVNCI
jgi:hypothetical protein